MKLTTPKATALRNGVKAVVYGKSGVGKTRLAATLKNAIILSAENGLLSIADEDIPVIEITSLQDLSDAYDFLEADTAGTYWNVVIDSVSEIAEVILTTAKAGVNDPRQAYGILIDDVTNLMRKFRDLKQKHVWMIAKEETYQDECQRIFSRPSLPGKALPNDLPYFYDLVLHLYVDYDGSRKLQTAYSPTAIAKDRSGKLNETEPPNLQLILDKIYKKD